MDYETMHGLWDAGSLVFLVIAFVALVAFVFRRGAGERYRRAAEIPLKDADRPGESPREEAEPGEGEAKR